jgi:hypothetical protein
MPEPAGHQIVEAFNDDFDFQRSVPALRNWQTTQRS